jgi:hypothetical protein
VNDVKSIGIRPIDLPALPSCPQVSVIISNFNYGQYIEQAMTSVLDQSYANIELIVCDDGSTDGSAGIIERVAARDIRVRPIFLPNRGQASAWNTAVSVARGEIICFLDSDDYCEPHKLEKVVQGFRSSPTAGVLIHRLTPVSACGQPLGPPIPAHLPHGWYGDDAFPLASWGGGPPTSGIAVRTDLLKLIMPFPARFSRGFSDGYITALGTLLTEMAAITDSLASYRIHDGNHTGTSAPTVSSIANTLDGMRQIIEEVRSHAVHDFGLTRIDALSLDHVQSYWEHVLAYRVLAGRMPPCQLRTCPSVAVRRVRSRVRRTMWMTLLSLPHQPAAMCLGIWWGVSPWKRFPRSISNALRAVGKR